MTRLLALLILMLASASLASADEVRYYQQDGITYRETRRVVQRPVVETKMQQREVTVYREKLSTEYRQDYRTCVTPVTEYQYVPYLIGTLVGITMPAVHASREAARRTHCTNNLRQLGLALLGYHDACRRFPVGCIELRAPAQPNGRQLAWSAHILPFLEEQPLIERLDLTKAFDAPENAAAAATVLPVFLCPTASHKPSVRGQTDYGGISGEWLPRGKQLPSGKYLPPGGGVNRWAGVLVFGEEGGGFNLHAIEDGASKTLIVGEDTLGPNKEWIDGQNMFQVSWLINAVPSSAWSDNSLRSQHMGGGAMGLFADGRVVFLPETLDSQVLSAICTRAGGESVELP